MEYIFCKGEDNGEGKGVGDIMQTKVQRDIKQHYVKFTIWPKYPTVKDVDNVINFSL